MIHPFGLIKNLADLPSFPRILHVQHMNEHHKTTAATDPSQDLRRCKEDAHREIVSAQVQLGLMYLHGQSVESDPREANRCFTLAATGKIDQLCRNGLCQNEQMHCKKNALNFSLRFMPRRTPWSNNGIQMKNLFYLRFCRYELSAIRFRAS